MTRICLLASLLIAACSATNVQVGSGGAAQAEKSTAAKVSGYAGSTSPPSNARSMGMMTMPRAGGSEIPIVDIEVFVFTANVDDDDSDETLYWAYDVESETVFVWGEIDLVCVDDDGRETGEDGSADFVYEEDPGGWGWMTSTDSCGYSTVFGCSDDGSGETCGGCDWDDTYVVCVSEK